MLNQLHLASIPATLKETSSGLFMITIEAQQKVFNTFLPVFKKYTSLFYSKEYILVLFVQINNMLLNKLQHTLLGSILIIETILKSGLLIQSSITDLTNYLTTYFSNKASKMEKERKSYSNS